MERLEVKKMDSDIKLSTLYSQVIPAHHLLKFLSPDPACTVPLPCRNSSY